MMALDGENTLGGGINLVEEDLWSGDALQRLAGGLAAATGMNHTTQLWPRGMQRSVPSHGFGEGVEHLLPEGDQPLRLTGDEADFPILRAVQDSVDHGRPIRFESDFSRGLEKMPSDPRSFIEGRERAEIGGGGECRQRGIARKWGRWASMPTEQKCSPSERIDIAGTCAGVQSRVASHPVKMLNHRGRDRDDAWSAGGRSGRGGEKFAFTCPQHVGFTCSHPLNQGGVGVVVGQRNVGQKLRLGHVGPQIEGIAVDRGRE
jgi:hypothetical protein